MGTARLLAHVVSLSVSENSITALIAACALGRGVLPAQRLMLVFAGTLYACNLCKAACRIPRPHHPGAAREHGYGFPSSHAAVSLALGLWGAATPRGYASAVAWAAAVGVSRLVLRVHSVTDVVGGWALGACAWACARPALAALESVSLAHALPLPLVVVALARLHPRAATTDITYSESMAVLGCAAGTWLSLWSGPLGAAAPNVGRQNVHATLVVLAKVGLAHSFADTVEHRARLHACARTLVRYACTTWALFASIP